LKRSAGRGRAGLAAALPLTQFLAQFQGSVICTKYAKILRDNNFGAWRNPVAHLLWEPLSSVGGRRPASEMLDFCVRMYEHLLDSDLDELVAADYAAEEAVRAP